MIKYKKFGLSGISQSLRKKYPIKITTYDNDIFYTIPIPKEYDILGYVYHNDSGPASYYHYDGVVEYYWYGKFAANKEQWLDPLWRRYVEMKVFFL